ncbi:MAG TPA: DUF1571 domain-containing protein [Burkholderiaceae bacterium]|nr:DUF1571 domain-containing protein [Burkholderiaceae bacterium]
MAAILMASALATQPLAAAIAAFGEVDAYRATLHAWSEEAGPQLVRYAWRRPGFVRMDFIDPHAGAVLVHDPKTGRATLWPFGVGAFPRLDLAPGNRLIRGSRGHTVDRSDVGVLLASAERLGRTGKVEVVGEESIDGRRAVHLAVTGAPGLEVDGVRRYDLWLRIEDLFPLQAESRDPHQRLLETTRLAGLEVGVRFPDSFFAP